MRHLIAGLGLLCIVGSAAAAELVFEQTSYLYIPGDSHPHQYVYDLHITGVDPLQPVNDFHLEWPLYEPGAIIVTAPAGWIGQEQLGNQWQMGFWADDEEYWVNENGTLAGWEIKGQNPQLVGGYAKLTHNGSDISNNVHVNLPIAPEPTTFVLLTLATLLRRR